MVTIPRDRLLVLILFCLFGTTGILATLYSLSGLPTGDTFLALYLLPMFGVIVAKATLSERVGVVNFSSCFGCVIGTIFVFQPRTIFSSDHQTTTPTIEIALAVLGSLSLGTCMVLVRCIGPGISALTCTFWLCMVTAPVGLVMSLVLATGPIIPPCGMDRVEIMIGGLLLLLSILLSFHCLSREPHTTPLVLMRFMDVVFVTLFRMFFIPGYKVDFLSGMGLTMVTGAAGAVFVHKLLKNVRLFESSYSHRSHGAMNNCSEKGA
eukprot:sb/3468310/